MLCVVLLWSAFTSILLCFWTLTSALALPLTWQDNSFFMRLVPLSQLHIPLFSIQEYYYILTASLTVYCSLTNRCYRSTSSLNDAASECSFLSDKNRQKNLCNCNMRGAKSAITNINSDIIYKGIMGKRQRRSKCLAGRYKADYNKAFFLTVHILFVMWSQATSFYQKMLSPFVTIGPLFLIYL